MHKEFVANTKTPDQMLGRVIEESGEAIAALIKLIQAAGKTIRFGPESVNPLLPQDQQVKNIDWLKTEMLTALGEMEDVVDSIIRFRQGLAQMEVAEDS